MFRFQNFLPLIGTALAGAAVFGMPAPTQADFTVRVTDVNSVSGTSTSTQTLVAPTGAGNFVGLFNNVGNFTVNIVTAIANTGPGFSSASETLNITRGSGNGTDTLIVEILDNNFSNPTAPSVSFISSNGSPSTAGLIATSVIMTSGVLANGATLGLAGTTLGGQLGETIGAGTMGSGSSVLTPNPVTGASFPIFNQFSFYQTYSISGFNNDKGSTGSLSAGSSVTATPEPGTVAMALTALPLLGLAYARRRRARA